MDINNENSGTSKKNLVVSYSFLFLFLFLKAGFLCATVLALLELAL